MNNNLLKLAVFIETLKNCSSLCIRVPCLEDKNAFFDIEWNSNENIRSWQYRASGSQDWIECAPTKLLLALENNNVDLGNLEAQLKQLILSKVTYCYDIVQEACDLFGEEVVYSNIENQHQNLEQDVYKLINDIEFNPHLRLIK